MLWTRTAATCFAAMACVGCQSVNHVVNKARVPDGPLPVWTKQEDIAKEMAMFYPSGTLNTLVKELEAARKDAPAGCSDAVQSRCIAQYARYQDLGFMISELHCNAYLSAISRAANYQKFARNTTNDLGVKTNAALGLFKSAMPVASFVNLGFGFVEGIYKNYDEAYFPGDDVRARLGLFHKARQDMLARYEAHPPKSLALADFRVNYYANSCTPEWIGRLVDASVDSSARKVDTNALLDTVGVVAGEDAPTVEPPVAVNRPR